MAVICATAGCGDQTSPDTDDSVDVGLTPSGGQERPAVFEPGQVTYAERSTVHVGDQDFDVSPQLVDSLDWTPYGVFLSLTTDPINGDFTDVFYDGTTMTTIDDVYSDVVTSPDGELAAWIDRSGPKRPAGRVAQVVVVEVRTGKVVFSSAEGMGGEKGDDLGDRYEELQPGVIELTDDTLTWRNSEGGGGTVTTDLATGESEVDEDTSAYYPATGGYLFRSPDGEHRVDAQTTGKLRIKPTQPDFGHKFQTFGGWLDGHTMLVKAQDRFKFSYDPTVPDTIPGFLLSCDLAVGTCEELEEVTGARDVVFAGVDVAY